MKNVTGGGSAGIGPGFDTTQDLGAPVHEYDNSKGQAHYQHEANSSAKGPTLHMTASQNNPSVRVTSKQKATENSMGAAASGAGIVDLDLHGQGSDLDPTTRMMARPTMRTSHGSRAAAGGPGSRRGHSQGSKQWAHFPMKVQNMNSLVQIKSKRPKMKYNDRLAFQAEKERQQYSQQIQSRAVAQKKFEKMLDGLLLMYSCRVKNPNQAIKSKLAGENIVDVREEDLLYFPNLTHLDVSDNHIVPSQLLNLVSLEELDLQYNNIEQLHLNQGCFPKLHTLILSYNKVPAGQLAEMGKLPNLTRLELASNELSSLPANLSFFKTLQELNLSSNNFSSDVLVDPNTIFGSLGTIPGLRKLTLSRNKLKKFHSDTLPQDNGALPDQERAFASLTELNLSFNIVDDEDALMYPATQIPTLTTLIITGNPFSITGQQENYENLEQTLHKRGAILVNETLNMPTFLRRGAGQRGRPPLALPAPADIDNMPKAKTGYSALEFYQDNDASQPKQPYAEGAQGPAMEAGQDENFFLTEDVGAAQMRSNQDLIVGEGGPTGGREKAAAEEDRQESADL